MRITYSDKTTTVSVDNTTPDVYLVTMSSGHDLCRLSLSESQINMFAEFFKDMSDKILDCEL